MTLAEIVEAMVKEARQPLVVLNAHTRTLEAIEAIEKRLAALETAQQQAKPKR